MSASKMLTVIDGTPGVFIPLRDGRISTDNPQNGQALIFDSALGEFVNADIPAQVNADWNAASGAAQILNKPDLAAVATSGSYNDLTDKPNNAAFGQGIVQAAVNNTSATIAVSFSNYALVTGGVVSLRFKNAVPANAKLNINSNGPKAIWFRGAAIQANVIKAGDRCIFMYNSGQGCYHLLAIDRWGVDIDSLAAVVTSGSYNDLTDKPVLVCEYDTDTDAVSGLSAVDIVAAVAAGADVLCRVDGTTFMVCDYAYEDENDEVQISFHNINPANEKICFVNCRSGTWSHFDRPFPQPIKTINSTSLLGSGNITLPTTLAGLGDTAVPSPQDGDVLVYDSGNSNWKNGEYHNPFHISTYTLQQQTSISLTHSLFHTREYVVYDCNALSDASITLNINAEYGGTGQTGAPREAYFLFKNIGLSNTSSLGLQIGNIKYNQTNSFQNVLKPGSLSVKTGYVEFHVKFLVDDTNQNNCHVIVTKHAES